MKFNAGCSLSYEVFSYSTLIFNISICRNRFQTVLEENLQVEPNTHTDTYISPEPENRYIRVNCKPGKLNVSYRAVVELADIENHQYEIPEIPPAELPLDVLPFLYPSRYCESDRLMRFVQAYFEAYLGNRWYLFDATRLVPRTGLIRIGTGRDAADVSFATIFGNVSMERMNLFVNSSGQDPVFTNGPIAYW